jgi:hypothetical protein
MMGRGGAPVRGGHREKHNRERAYSPDWPPGSRTVDLYCDHDDEADMTEIADTFDSAFTKAVDLGNRLADKDKDADLWDIADGLLAGALQYWLYSRQPCGDPRCQDCMPISTAEGRMAELKRLMEQLAAESEYFHTPTDANAGRA